jgi:hypothetical protein
MITNDAVEIHPPRDKDADQGFRRAVVSSPRRQQGFARKESGERAQARKEAAADGAAADAERSGQQRQAAVSLPAPLSARSLCVSRQVSKTRAFIPSPPLPLQRDGTVGTEDEESKTKVSKARRLSNDYTTNPATGPGAHELKAVSLRDHLLHPVPS